MDQRELHVLRSPGMSIFEELKFSVIGVEHLRDMRYWELSLNMKARAILMPFLIEYFSGSI